MKIIQCAHPPHHYNGLVATCRLWMASDGVQALLVLETTKFLESTRLATSNRLLNKHYATGRP